MKTSKAMNEARLSPQIENKPKKPANRRRPAANRRSEGQPRPFAREEGPLNRSTVEQLRSDIDHGRTGDKIEGSDPAAAPLGADEEAAGTPVPLSVVSEVQAAERRGRADAPRKPRGLGAAWVLIGIIVVFATGIAMWLLLI